MSILSVNKFLLNIGLLNSSDSGSGVARFADHVPNTLMGIYTAVIYGFLPFDIPR